MIAQIGHRLKVEKSDRVRTTSFAGLPLLTELAHRTGLIADLNAIPGLWKRDGRYGTADYLMSLALTLIAGGEGLDDTRVLRHDGGLGQLVLPDMPAANSQGDFLRRFSRRSLHKLSGAVTGLAVKNILPGQTLTLDMDSSLIESDKETARRTYEGFRGYNPMLAWLAEPGVFLAGLFRDGNASPQSHLRSLLRYCLRRLPAGVKLRLRSDSAGYRLDLIEECHKRGIEFAIRADLDTAVREAIEQIPETAWRLVVRGEDVFLLAETIHVPGGGNNRYNLPAFRLIVTRRTGQLELFKDPIRHLATLTSLPESFTTEQALDFYNGRGNAEKAIGELKNGFGLHGLPCADLNANAAYFQTCLLAYNLAQTFKRVALPMNWRSLGIKNLRFRLLCRAALVIRHARRLTLKVFNGFPFFEIFERARWAVLSPLPASAG